MVDIHETGPTDLGALRALYADAFPDEDLWPLVQVLVTRADVVSLGAYAEGVPVGHVCITLCGVEGAADRVGLLAPLGVLTRWQGQGIGGTLIGESLARLSLLGAGQMNVLGDPKYYGRFGFEADAHLSPPYPLPEAWRTAWQVRRASAEAPVLQGVLQVPPPWRDPALWGA